MKHYLVAMTSVGLAYATTALADTPDAAARAIAAAERAFAADGAARGVGPSFVAFAAPEAIVLNPDPVSARALYEKRAPSKPGDPVLKWWPVRVIAARSGDLGFDTGPWVFGNGKATGWFGTVWARQPDGSWKWLLDHGFDGPASTLGPDTPLTVVRPADHGVGRASVAVSQVKAAEAALSRELLAGHLTRAYAASLAGDAWIGGLEPDGPRTTPATIAKALLARPQTIRTAQLGGGASMAGDLAWTFGKASWDRDGKAMEGRYVRIWRRDRGGWRIVFDETTPN